MRRIAPWPLNRFAIGCEWIGSPIVGSHTGLPLQARYPLLLLQMIQIELKEHPSSRLWWRSRPCKRHRAGAP